MDKTPLVEKDMEEGRRLIEALDKTEFQVEAAMWFYSTDSGEWQLLIASPFVEKNGPKKAYGFIQSELAKLSPTSGISLKDISVLSPKHHLIALLRKAIRTGSGISSIRFTRNVINNTLIEDAYIYRMRSTHNKYTSLTADKREKKNYYGKRTGNKSHSGASTGCNI